MNVAGVYITGNPPESPTEYRFLFISNELLEADTGEVSQPATFSQVPHIQAEIVMGKDLAGWIWKYLDSFFKPKEAS